jgi:hypothetical protein
VITEQDNQRLTSVMRGTPGGELLRRYWYPVATAAEMTTAWTKRVRLLGEDLVLYRDRSARLGLIGEFCRARRSDLGLSRARARAAVTETRRLRRRTRDPHARLRTRAVQLAADHGKFV